MAEETKQTKNKQANLKLISGVVVGLAAAGIIAYLTTQAIKKSHDAKKQKENEPGV